MMKSNLCVLCAHYRNDATCAAYPNAIPDEIFAEGATHFQPRGDDKGIVFEPKNEQAQEAAQTLGYKPVRELVEA